MANLGPDIFNQFFDNNGDPLSGGKLYTYQAGTTTPQATYTDSGALTPNANPIILDANGRCTLWLDPALSYKFVLTTSADVTIKTVDNVIGLLTADAVNTAALQDDSVTPDKLAHNLELPGTEGFVPPVGTTAQRPGTPTAGETRYNSTIGDLETFIDSVWRPFLPTRPGFINVGLAQGASSAIIKITGANGTALSATNPGWVIMSGATAGLLTVFKVIADVSITLTGAHWGFDTGGDLTDQPLSVLALNDAGTLKWGVAQHGGRSVVLDSDDSATPSDINLWDEVLVNSALTSDAHAQHLGYFLANFDDTGGASENLWAVQTGTGDIVIGPNVHCLRQRKSLTSSVTSTGQVALLGFSNLRAGDVISYVGNFWGADVGANNADVNLTVVVEDDTTDVAEWFYNLSGTIDIDSYNQQASVVIAGHIMASASMNVNVTTVTGASFVGGAGALMSYSILTLHSEGGFIPKNCVFS